MQMVEAHAEGEVGRIRTIDTTIILSLYANKITLNLSSPSIIPPRSEAQERAQSRPHPLSNIESLSANSVSNPDVGLNEGLVLYLMIIILNNS